MTRLRESRFGGRGKVGQRNTPLLRRQPVQKSRTISKKTEPANA